MKIRNGLLIAMTALFTFGCTSKGEKMALPGNRYDNGIFYFVDTPKMSQFVAINPAECSALVKRRRQVGEFVRFSNETLVVWRRTDSGAVEIAVTESGRNIVECLVSGESFDRFQSIVPPGFHQKYLRADPKEADPKGSGCVN